MEDEKIVPPGWINSVVINDYEEGGFIVQHQGKDTNVRKFSTPNFHLKSCGPDFLITPFLGGSELLYKIWAPNYFFKRQASYNFTA